ncbi:unnamed protein product [Arctia plantaginis]|uniref:Uncharacterized protein n=1 Tax=Arctia plantaginis TaxID=874455 RepID=A0A8S0Z5E4_ARCPL|nr:unnamed protein product [Arctia plantaginis]
MELVAGSPEIESIIWKMAHQCQFNLKDLKNELQYTDVSAIKLICFETAASNYTPKYITNVTVFTNQLRCSWSYCVRALERKYVLRAKFRFD